MKTRTSTYKHHHKKILACANAHTTGVHTALMFTQNAYTAPELYTDTIFALLKANCVPVKKLGTFKHPLQLTLST